MVGHMSNRFRAFVPRCHLSLRRNISTTVTFACAMSSVAFHAAARLPLSTLSLILIRWQHCPGLSLFFAELLCTRIGGYEGVAAANSDKADDFDRAEGTDDATKHAAARWRRHDAPTPAARRRLGATVIVLYIYINGRNRRMNG
eukprot:GHVU01078526.1.p1 GENE.GHVU01078526.1~~GHVU01078526.1.p1  ORF type:complete len:144 (+),score=6.45 GHVU01078526.1:141-572(+)